MKEDEQVKKARMRGKRDFKSGVPLAKNPYLSLSRYKILAGHWEAGWHEEKKAEDSILRGRTGGVGTAFIKESKPESFALARKSDKSSFYRKIPIECNQCWYQTKVSLNVKRYIDNACSGKWTCKKCRENNKTEVANAILATAKRKNHPK